MLGALFSAAGDTDDFLLRVLSTPSRFSLLPSSIAFFASSPPSAADDVLLSFRPFSRPFSVPFFLFLPLATHCGSSVGGFAAFCPSSAARSASSCCFRKISSCSSVSLFTAASCLRVASRTESRYSASSSLRARNWFFRRVASSKAACLASYRRKSNMSASLASTCAE